MRATTDLERAYFELCRLLPHEIGEEAELFIKRLRSEAASLGEAADVPPRARQAHALRLRSMATCLARTPGLEGGARERLERIAESLPAACVSAGRYQLTVDWNVEHEREWFARLTPLAGGAGVRALEVGCHEGQTTCWLLDHVLTGVGASITCIDPFDDTDPFFGAYADRFRANVRAARRDDVEVLVGRSREILPQLAGRSYDFIYLDGAHDSQSVLGDLVLAWDLLAADGLLCLDDVDAPGLPGVRRALDAFLSCLTEPVDVEVVAMQAWLIRAWRT